MRALVIYESIFGNTQAVAEAIAAGLGEGLGEGAEVECVEVGAAPEGVEAGREIIVVGGPTHAWSMSRAGTRAGAREQAKERGQAAVSRGVGVREWLARLSKRSERGYAATFDTALRPRAWFPVGSAAQAAGRALEDRRYRLLVEPEHFFVNGIDGPLEDGEVARARAWGAALVARRRASATVPRRPRRRPGERVGEIVANLVGLIVINLYALWLPFTFGVVTDDFADVVPALSAFALLTIVDHVVALAVGTPRAGLVADVLAAALAIAGTAVVLRVFPFDFGAIGLPWIALIAHGVLIFALVVGCIRLVADLLRFGFHEARALADG
ncbi:MAG: hypothetical protein KC420_18360 [Myxococcales bacterium]|nr:hypothetical protein [Myxococcales bacterium]MCB9568348.1 hypothetical protein [Myxococcales bacterium]